MSGSVAAELGMVGCGLFAAGCMAAMMSCVGWHLVLLLVQLLLSTAFRTLTCASMLMRRPVKIVKLVFLCIFIIFLISDRD